MYVCTCEYITFNTTLYQVLMYLICTRCMIPAFNATIAAAMLVLHMGATRYRHLVRQYLSASRNNLVTQDEHIAARRGIEIG